MKKQFTAIIVDDEPLARQVLKNDLLEKCPYVEVIGEAANAQLARKLIKERSPDIVFIDVQMPEESGIHLLKGIENKSFITIIYSSYEEFAYDALKLDVADYLLKPLDPMALQESMDKLYSNLYQEETNQVQDERREFFTSGRKYYLRIQDIGYVEASGSYSVLHLRDGRELMLSRNLKWVTEFIDSDYFIRAHNSFLINVNYVSHTLLKKNECVLMNGVKLPISSRKREEFKQKIHQAFSYSVQHHTRATQPKRKLFGKSAV
ncbi:MAG: response regulator transcription factor [Flavobacteriales bacterium]|nr:response regulator transcription factor [Flavobacteriales bacterium]